MICVNCGNRQDNKLGSECLYCKDEKIELRLKGYVYKDEILEDLENFHDSLIADNKVSTALYELIRKYRKLNV